MPITFCYDKQVDNVYVKKIEPHEKQFWRILKDTAIVPTVISLGDLPQKYNTDNWFPEGCYVVTEMYPYTLAEWMTLHPEDTVYYKKLPDLVQRLHDHGILHGDLLDNNIVVNPTTQDVRVIDFDGSEWIVNVSPEDLAQDNFYWGKTFSTVDEMLHYEKIEIYKE
jgi:serine/threonine protein kinase